MSNKIIDTKCHGIVVTLDFNEGGTISSNLHAMFKDPDLPENDSFHEVSNAAADALESFILALACEGVDIESPSFLCALETSVQNIANNLPDKEQIYEINREIVVSTAHISEDINRALDWPSNPPLEGHVTVYAYEYGHRILITDDDRDHVLSGKNFNSGFKELDILVKLAVDNGCRWILLDRDGPEIPGMEKFDW